MSKLQDIWNHPYLAPVAEPVRNLVNIGGWPLRYLGETFRLSGQDGSRGYSRAGRFYAHLFRDDTSGADVMSVGIFMGGLIGAMGAGAMSGLGAWHALAGAGVLMQGAAAGAAVIAAAAVTAAASPLLVTGLATFVALAAAVAVGVPAGIIVGANKAVRRFHGLGEPVSAAPIAAPATATESILVPEDLMMKVLMGVDKLDPAQHPALVAALQKKLGNSFGAAVEEAPPQEDISVMKPIKFATPATAKT